MKRDEWEYYTKKYGYLQEPETVQYLKRDINTAKQLLRDKILEKPDDTLEQVLVLLGKTI